MAAGWGVRMSCRTPPLAFYGLAEGRARDFSLAVVRCQVNTGSAQTEYSGELLSLIPWPEAGARVCGAGRGACSRAGPPRLPPPNPRPTLPFLRIRAVEPSVLASSIPPKRPPLNLPLA